MPVVKFQDRDVRPPKNGWSFPIQGKIVTRHSESAIIQEMLAAAKANNRPYDRNQATVDLWSYYNEREPERARAGRERVDGKPSEADVLVPEVWGPIIWRFLNLAAARYNETFFKHLVGQVSALMTCPECRQEWRKVVEERPPTDVVDAKSACVWVNHMHNAINARLGRKPYSYSRMVTEYGAPP